MSLGESVASGPFFKAYVVNLLPGQFVQPFIDAAFSDLGLDPNVLLPSELTDPQTGQPATPALPVPYPRTGQGGEPQLEPARRDHRQPRRSGLRSARPAAARPHRLLPLPRTAAGPAARRAAARAARRGAARAESTPEPTPNPVAVPAPGEAPPPRRPDNDAHRPGTAWPLPWW